MTASSSTSTTRPNSSTSTTRAPRQACCQSWRCCRTASPRSATWPSLRRRWHIFGPTTLRGFDYQQLAREVRQAVPGLRHVLVAGSGADPDVISLDALLEDPIEERESADGLRDVRPDPADVALFLLSGGTTGLPKLIPRTHNDYEYNSRASGALCAIDADTVYLVVLPISHNFPLASPGLQSVLQAGGRIVLCDSPDPVEAFRLIEQERVTHTALGARTRDALDGRARARALRPVQSARAAGWRRQAQSGAGATHPSNAGLPAPAGVRDGRGPAQLHPTGRSRRGDRRDPGPAVLAGRRDPHRRPRGR